MPLLAYVAIVATPAYVRFPLLGMFAAPAVVASLGLALLLARRAVRHTAWLVLACLGLWLLQNVFALIQYAGRWNMGALDALGHGAARAPYWLAMLLPMLAAGALLIWGRPARFPRKPDAP